MIVINGKQSIISGYINGLEPYQHLNRARFLDSFEIIVIISISFVLKDHDSDPLDLCPVFWSQSSASEKISSQSLTIFGSFMNTKDKIFQKKITKP